MREKELCVTNMIPSSYLFYTFHLLILPIDISILGLIYARTIEISKIHLYAVDELQMYHHDA